MIGDHTYDGDPSGPEQLRADVLRHLALAGDGLGHCRGRTVAW